MEEFIHDKYTLKAIELVRKGQSFFITGKAGTGKTRLLREIVRESRARGKNIAVAAPTGIAAKNAEGQTLHSLFGLKTITFIPGKTRNWYHLNTAKERVIRKLDILIIDEISMVRCDVLDMVDQTLKKVRWSSSAFGGIQVLFFGDLFQLPPVVEDDDEKLLYSHYEQDNPYFFSSDVIRKRPLPLLELEKVHRQKDERFVRILNNIREGKNLSSDIAAINRRYKADYEPSNSELAIYLRTRKYNVWKHNDSKLKELPSEKFTSTAEIYGYFPKRLFPADEELALKVGAKVMLLRNDNDDYEYVNGTLGIVKSIYGGVVRVITQEGNLISVEKSAWTLYKYEYDERNKIIKPFPVGSFTQYPIKLAWAVTIHKSQGLTFDNVIIDAHRAFASGQVYVALSRCRSLKGIVLTSKISKDDIKLDPIIVDYMKSVEKILPDETIEVAEVEETNIFFFDENDERMITGIRSEVSGEIEIPEGVEVIAEKAFKDNTNITSAIFPTTLREIGNFAFRGCKNLHSINFKEGIVSIGVDAFIGTALQEVSLPQSLKEIDLTPFECRMKVDNLNDYFSSDINGALYNAEETSLILYPRKGYEETIEIPDMVTCIESYAFENNKASEIILPEDLEELQNKVFYGCENLRTLTLKTASPSDIVIDNETFKGFEVEKCILRVPFDSLSDYINDERFGGFSYITDIEGSICLKYDNSRIEVVGYEKKSGESIVIPEGVEIIEEQAFKDNNITSVICPDSLREIKYQAFYGCKNLRRVALNDGLISIGQEAFLDTNLKSVEIPDTVNVMGLTPFECAMKVYKNNRQYSDIDGVLYTKDQTSLILYPRQYENKELEIPFNVCSIKAYAFECNKAEEIILPDNISNMEKCLFNECQNLKTLIIKKDLPEEIKIVEDTFEGFDVEECVLRVPFDALSEYVNDERFKVFKYITAIEGSRCLKYNESGSAVVDSETEDCANIVIPEGVTNISEGAFQGNEEIERVILPKTLLKIGNASFSGCHNLSEIKLNKGLRDIGWDAFKGTGLSWVKIPDSVVKIGYSAFSCEIEVSSRNTHYCTNDGVLYSHDERKLVIYPEYKENEEFEVPSTVEVIGSYAFEDTCLATLVLHDSITSLHNNIFGSTSEISTLILHCEDPNELYIDDNVFEDFNKQQCKLVVPYGRLSLYASNKHFKDFLSISEMTEDGEYTENATEPKFSTGQYSETLPGNNLAESKVFCYYNGKYHCYIVLSSEGFFLKLMDGGYYYLSELINGSVSGSIWVMNKKEKLTSYMVAYSIDNITKYSFGHFTERTLEGTLSYKDVRTGKDFTIDLETGNKL